MTTVRRHACRYMGEKRSVAGRFSRSYRPARGSLITLGWRFSADRMVMDYVTRAYIPAAGGTSSSDPVRF